MRMHRRVPLPRDHSCLSLPTHDSDVRVTAPLQEHDDGVFDDAARPSNNMTPLAVRVLAEFREMPGLRLTTRQAARLFGVAPDIADGVLDELHRASILRRSHDGVFALVF